MPITTIKYYLREGLLPGGALTAHNQALYTEQHLRRLRLISALVSVRGLSVSATADILKAVSDDGGSLHRSLGLVLGALQVDEKRQQPARDVPAAYLEQAQELIDALGWRMHPKSKGRTELARSLHRMAEVGLDLDTRSLFPYAELAQATAVLDLNQLAGTEDDRLGLSERAILVTVLLEPVLLLLRRMAQENESAARYGTAQAAD